MPEPIALLHRAGRWTHAHATQLAARITARRRADEARLLEWPAILAAAMSDRGMCDTCGHEHSLRQDGRLREHHGCPGGDQLPAPNLIGGAA